MVYLKHILGLDSFCGRPVYKLCISRWELFVERLPLKGEGKCRLNQISLLWGVGRERPLAAGSAKRKRPGPFFLAVWLNFNLAGAPLFL